MDWADDVRCLLDALAIEQCAVFGWSMGGQYALACAARLAERVTRTTVVAGCLPVDTAETFAQLNPMDRRLTRLAQRRPRVADEVFRALGVVARRAPNTSARAALHGAVPDERATVAELPDPGLAGAAAHTLEHGNGMTEEYRAWARPWGFTPEDVPGTVDVWQGDRDEFVPPAWGAALATRLPDGRFHDVAGAGHFLGYTHTEQLLATLTTRPVS